MKPFFTIITATFNSEQTLERTINSVLNQTFTDFEYLIIDGNSLDKTVTIIKQFEIEFKKKNIIYKYISESDKGLYDAWNKGIELSKGEWISFLGSDDYYLQDALETYKQNLHSNYNYIHSNVQLINESGKNLKILGEQMVAGAFFRNMEIAHVGSFHHKSLFESENFSLKYKSANDYYFFLRNFEKINSFYINKITAVMQYGGVSTNVNSSLKEALFVKLETNKRNKLLCYMDFFIDHLKHFCLKYIRKI